LGCFIMKASEFRAMSDEQIQGSLKDLEKNLFHLRFQAATDRLEASSEIRKAKKDIARIKTVLTERAAKLKQTGSTGSK